MLLALRRQLDLNISSREGEESQLIICDVLMALWRAFLSAAEQLASCVVMQYVKLLFIEQLQ